MLFWFIHKIIKQKYFSLDDKEVEDLSTIEDTLTNHHSLLSKGFALSESILTVNQALESYLPIG